MDIQRRYEPDPEAVDRVVQILYRLLVESPGDRAEGGQVGAAQTPPSTCISGETEG
jgi:hypothetical protein